jgi:hypothetical protein
MIPAVGDTQQLAVIPVSLVADCPRPSGVKTRQPAALGRSDLRLASRSRRWGRAASNHPDQGRRAPTCTHASLETRRSVAVNGPRRAGLCRGRVTPSMGTEFDQRWARDRVCVVAFAQLDDVAGGWGANSSPCHLRRFLRRRTTRQAACPRALGRVDGRVQVRGRHGPIRNGRNACQPSLICPTRNDDTTTHGPRGRGPTAAPVLAGLATARPDLLGRSPPRRSDRCAAARRSRTSPTP